MARASLCSNCRVISPHAGAQINKTDTSTSRARGTKHKQNHTLQWHTSLDPPPLPPPQAEALTHTSARRGQQLLERGRSIDAGDVGQEPRAMREVERLRARSVQHACSSIFFLSIANLFAKYPPTTGTFPFPCETLTPPGGDRTQPSLAGAMASRRPSLARASSDRSPRCRSRARTALYRCARRDLPSREPICPVC